MARPKVPLKLVPKDNRFVIQMDLSYDNHPHLIGPDGLKIRKLMSALDARVHFPDSNRHSILYKCNDVRFHAGSINTVERTRQILREHSHLTFQFYLPEATTQKLKRRKSCPFKSFLADIFEKYRARIDVRRPNLSGYCLVIVRGAEWNSVRIKDSLAEIIPYCFGPKMDGDMELQSVIDISCAQHDFVRGVDDCNLKRIIDSTGVQIHFPRLRDASQNGVDYENVFAENMEHIHCLRVTICGSASKVHEARQQLISSLPLQMVLEVPHAVFVNIELVHRICEELAVTVQPVIRTRAGFVADKSLPYSVPTEAGRRLYLKVAEKDSENLFNARSRILNESFRLRYKEIPIPPGLPPLGQSTGDTSTTSSAGSSSSMNRCSTSGRSESSPACSYLNSSTNEVSDDDGQPQQCNAEHHHLQKEFRSDGVILREDETGLFSAVPVQLVHPIAPVQVIPVVQGNPVIPVSYWSSSSHPGVYFVDYVESNGNWNGPPAGNVYFNNTTTDYPGDFSNTTDYPEDLNNPSVCPEDLTNGGDPEDGEAGVPCPETEATYQTADAECIEDWPVPSNLNSPSPQMMQPEQDYSDAYDLNNLFIMDELFSSIDEKDPEKYLELFMTCDIAEVEEMIKFM